MTRPASSSRLILVEDRRGAAAADTRMLRLRRYRLARLRFEGPADSSAGRFDYLKRLHD